MWYWSCLSSDFASAWTTLYLALEFITLNNSRKAKPRINSGTKRAISHVRTHMSCCRASETCRPGTSEWMIVQVQAKMVEEQLQTMSHVERLFVSSCQLSSPLDAETRCSTGRRNSKHSKVSIRHSVHEAFMKRFDRSLQIQLRWDISSRESLQGVRTSPNKAPWCCRSLLIFNPKFPGSMTLSKVSRLI